MGRKRDWEKFEIECVNYLKENFGKYAEFIHQGKSDSTVPDIKVIPKKRKIKKFYIEVKLRDAQCGQFVVFPNDKTKSFDYSPENKTSSNKYTDKIIEHMNTDFERYKKSVSKRNPLDKKKGDGKGQKIDMPNGSDIFAKWIVDNYRKKEVKFFITYNFTIFPIAKFTNYFETTAKYRPKGSGSSEVPKCDVDDVTSFIKKNYSIIDTKSKGKKLFAISTRNLDNKRFNIDERYYMFSFKDMDDEGNYRYKIRKLSTTYNPTVIFSIKPVNKKNPKTGLSDDEFIKKLQ